MGQLILHNRDGIEVGSRPMEASERGFDHQAWFGGELIAHAGQQYRLVTVAWCVPQGDLRCEVVCEGLVPVVYDDD